MGGSEIGEDGIRKKYVLGRKIASCGRSSGGIASRGG